MLRRTVTTLLFLALPGCGSPPVPEAPPEALPPPPAPASAEPVADVAPAPSAAPAPPAIAAPVTQAAPAPPPSAADLARDLLKGVERTMGHSSTKQEFVFPIQRFVNKGGRNGFGLDVQFVGDDGKARDTVHVCSLRECEDQAFDLGKDLRPKLTERLEKEGYTALQGLDWPSEAASIQIYSLGLKLQYAKGGLTAEREGKPTVSLAALAGKKLDAAPHSVFALPDGPLMAVVAQRGDTRELYQELYVFKLP